MRSRSAEVQELRRLVAATEDNRWLYVYGLAEDVPVTAGFGNRWYRPHRIGVSAQLSNLNRQGRQWCWWRTGVVDAWATLGAPMARRLEAEVGKALRSVETVSDGDLEGRWVDISREELALTIRLCASRAEIPVWSVEEQAERMRARKAAILRLRVMRMVR